jgi:hypothetical protein
MKAVGVLLVLLGLVAAALGLRAVPDRVPRSVASGPTAGRAASESPTSCAGCHRARQPGLLAQWDASGHARAGVACSACHGEDHEAIFAEHGRVPAGRCATCHEQETAEFLASPHAHAAEGALGNARLLAQIPAMQRRGCMGCHDLGTGEHGGCNACHGAHRHSAADARRPESCGRCHMGPDHPHLEAYLASPHGVAWEACGGDERQAPSCVTCHMPGGTHAVGGGITRGRSGSGAVLEGETQPIPMHVISPEHARTQREAMLALCARCHGARLAREALEDADAIKIEADRLVGVAADLVRALHDEGLLDPAPADRPAHPTAGHALVLGGPMLYENQSEAERIFFDLAKFGHAITFKSAYHQAADHTHWLGIARMKASLVALEAEARRLRAAR